jgi:hypothetical protein
MISNAARTGLLNSVVKALELARIKVGHLQVFAEHARREDEKRKTRSMASTAFALESGEWATQHLDCIMS